MDGIVPRIKEMDLAEFGGEGKWTIRAMSNGVRKRMKAKLIEIGKKEGYSLKDLSNEETWEGLMYMYGDDVLTEAIATCIIAGPGVVDGKMSKETLDELPQELVMWLYQGIEEISKFPLGRTAGAAVSNALSQPTGE